MVFQVIPRERMFYDLLERAADNVAAGARELASLVDALPGAASQHQRIRDLERQLAGVQKELQTLRTELNADPQLVVIPLKNADAGKVVVMINELLGIGPHLTLDAAVKTNSVVIRAGARQIVQARAIIERVDVKK